MSRANHPEPPRLAPAGRALAVVTAATGALGLGLQALATSHDLGLSGLPLVWHMAGYFTLLSAFLYTLTIAWEALRALPSPAGWQGGVLLWMLITGIVFNVLLAALSTATGLGRWATVLLHDVLPALAVLHWLFVAPKAGIGPRHAVLWLLWPLGYSLYAILRGLATGAYPYYFLDLGRLGLSLLLRNLGLLALAMLLGGLLLVTIARVLSRSAVFSDPSLFRR